MKAKYWDIIGRAALGVTITMLILAAIEAYAGGPAGLHVKIAGIAFLVSLGCMFASIGAEQKEAGRR